MNPAIRQKLNLYLDLIRWNRPAGWLLLYWPTVSALWLAADGFPGWHLFLVFTLGTILMRSAGCCVNDVADQDFDRHVKRTQQRPVTRGAISTPEALGLGVVLAMMAFGLVLTTNALTIWISFGALAVAVAYPFAKRWIAMPQAVLGLAFSFGIPMAYAAARGEIPVQAAAIVVANVFWVLAYDTEYAMVDRDDDLRIGMKTSAITLGRWDVSAVMTFYFIYLLIWLYQLTHKGLNAILFVVIFVALGQVGWHYRLIKSRTREGCFKAFRVNHWLGFTLFVATVFAVGW